MALRCVQGIETNWYPDDTLLLCRIQSKIGCPIDLTLVLTPHRVFTPKCQHPGAILHAASRQFVDSFSE